MDSIFICFEGIAGAGKTTQSLILHDNIQKVYNRNSLISKAFERERKELTEQFIKDLKLKNNDMAIMFIFQALHAAQYQEVINALDAGKIVIADRWRETFFAYHNLFGPLVKESDDVKNHLDRLAFQTLEPDLNILLDVSAEQAYDRFTFRERDKGILGSFDIDFFRKTRDYYIDISSKKKWPVIDASLSIDEVQRNIWRLIDNMYGKQIINQKRLQKWEK